MEDGWGKARVEIDNRIEDAIERQVGGDDFRLKSKFVDYSNIKFKHILLPIWISSYSFRSKTYSYIVNGESGKVSGRYPKSPWKIGGLIVLAIAIGVAIYAFAYSSR